MNTPKVISGSLLLFLTVATPMNYAIDNPPPPLLPMHYHNHPVHHVLVPNQGLCLNDFINAAVLGIGGGMLVFLGARMGYLIATEEKAIQELSEIKSTKSALNYHKSFLECWKTQNPLSEGLSKDLPQDDRYFFKCIERQALLKDNDAFQKLQELNKDM